MFKVNQTPKRSYFGSIIGYSQPSFQTFYSGPFTSSYSLQHFLFNRNTVKACLQDCQIIGAHSNILVFEKECYREYSWSHPISRPFGKVSSRQCPQCNCFIEDAKATKVTNEGKTITSICKNRNCGERTIVDMPEGWNWLYDLASPRGGSWIVFKHKIAKLSNK